MHPSAHARSTPRTLAVVMNDGSAAITYAELEARSNQVAQLFRSLGLRRGDVVALLAHNSVRYFDLVWGAQRAGLYYTCVSSRLSPGEAAYIVADSGASVLIASDTLAETALAVAALVDGVTLMMSGRAVPPFAPFDAAAAAMPATPIADESNGTDMLYSSGTTGRPKGVKPPLPEGPLGVPNTLTNFAARAYAIGPETIFLSPAPLYHAAPLRWCMTTHRLGGTVVLMEHFEAEAALAALERFGATHAQWVPTHFIRMLRLPPDVRDAYDVSSLRVAFHAAAPCPVPVKEAIMAWWGPIVHEYYGATEGNGLTAIGPADWLTHKGSVGKAVVGELRICDEDGEPVGARREGTVYFANGEPFAYHNDPIKTALSRNRYGWTTLGDIGWVDEDGYLYLTDRRSFTIICGGVNVYPAEIENLLVTHPKVADVAVIGAPDEDMGEGVVAVVQPLDWNDRGPALAAELLEWLRPQLGRVKLPRTIDFDPDLPRHPNGKLLKRLVRERYWPVPTTQR